MEETGDAAVGLVSVAMVVRQMTEETSCSSLVSKAVAKAITTTFTGLYPSWMPALLAAPRVAYCIQQSFLS